MKATAAAATTDYLAGEDGKRRRTESSTWAGNIVAGQCIDQNRQPADLRGN